MVFTLVVVTYMKLKYFPPQWKPYSSWINNEGININPAAIR